MSITAHDDHIRTEIRGGRQDYAGDVRILCHDALELDLELVAGEMLSDIDARQFVARLFVASLSSRCRSTWNAPEMASRLQSHAPQPGFRPSTPELDRASCRLFECKERPAPAAPNRIARFPEVFLREILCQARSVPTTDRSNRRAVFANNSSIPASSVSSRCDCAETPARRAAASNFATAALPAFSSCARYDATMSAATPLKTLPGTYGS